MKSSLSSIDPFHHHHHQIPHRSSNPSYPAPPPPAPGPAPPPHGGGPNLIDLHSHGLLTSTPHQKSSDPLWQHHSKKKQATNTMPVSIPTQRIETAIPSFHSQFLPPHQHQPQQHGHDDRVRLIQEQSKKRNAKAMETFVTVKTKSSAYPSASSASSSSSAMGKPTANPKRVCKICSRQFSTGRALGGHMRVHGPYFMQSQSQSQSHAQAQAFYRSGEQTMTKKTEKKIDSKLPYSAAELEHHSHGRELKLSSADSKILLPDGGGDGCDERRMSLPGLTSADDDFTIALGRDKYAESGSGGEGVSKVSIKAAEKEDGGENGEEEEEEEEEEEGEESMTMATFTGSEIEDELTTFHGQNHSHSHQQQQRRHHLHQHGDGDREGDIENRRATSLISNSEIDDEYSASEGEFNGRMMNRHHQDSKIRDHNNLYKLRHNPKRSHRLTDEEFLATVKVRHEDPPTLQASMEARRPREEHHNHRIENTVTCSECGKAFLSRKALFGHMRCHPEREWRGILPPSSAIASSSTVREDPPRPFNKKMKAMKESQKTIHEFAQIHGEAPEEVDSQLFSPPMLSFPSSTPLPSEAEEKKGLKLCGHGYGDQKLLGDHQKIDYGDGNIEDHQNIGYGDGAKLVDDQKIDIMMSDDDWMKKSSSWPRGKRSRRSSSSASSGGHGHGKASKLVTSDHLQTSEGRGEEEEEEEEVPTLSSSETTSLAEEMGGEEGDEEGDDDDDDDDDDDENENCLFLLAEAANIAFEQEGGEDLCIKSVMEVAADQDMGSSHGVLIRQQKSPFPRIQAQEKEEGEKEGEIETPQPSNRSFGHGYGNSHHRLSASTGTVVGDYVSNSAEKLSIVAGHGAQQFQPSPQLMRYECSTCKKTFSSHQALGGHRASHKKTKGCGSASAMSTEIRTTTNPINNITGEVCEANRAINGSTKEVSAGPQQWQNRSFGTEQNEKMRMAMDSAMMMVKKRKKKKSLQERKEKKQIKQRCDVMDDDDDDDDADNDMRNGIRNGGKGHECSICHRVFPTGQALGGHKRCHWTGGEKPSGQHHQRSLAMAAQEKEEQRLDMESMYHGRQQQDQPQSVSLGSSNNNKGMADTIDDVKHMEFGLQSSAAELQSSVSTNTIATTASKILVSDESMVACNSSSVEIDLNMPAPMEHEAEGGEEYGDGEDEMEVGFEPSRRI